MGYKIKPNKAVLSRFKVSKNGKLKAGHCYTSHLMSARTPKSKQQKRRAFTVAECIAGPMRLLMGVSGKNPKRTAHYRRLAVKRAELAAKTEAATPAAK